MKKLVISVLLISVSSVFANAQETAATFAKKDNVIGVGFGIGGVYGISGFSSQSPTFGVQYDRGVAELGMGGVIGVGGFFGYKGIVDKKEYFGETYRDKWNIVIFGVRGTFHYDLFKVENLDTYAGTMIAFHLVKYKQDYPDNPIIYDNVSNSSAAYASIYAGAKYYFAPQISAFAEIGYGVSWLTLGAAFKF